MAGPGGTGVRVALQKSSSGGPWVFKYLKIRKFRRHGPTLKTDTFAARKMNFCSFQNGHAVDSQWLSHFLGQSYSVRARLWQRGS